LAQKVVEMNDSADRMATQREVRATFPTPAQLQEAVSKLTISGFDRADLSLPSPGLLEGTETLLHGADDGAEIVVGEGELIQTHRQE